jgi:2-polyprenyl-6-methoxyphenol hydroxylase-like FAD-dependent oxidoreductase
MLPVHADVLVVGAGPSGLALAIVLRQAGVDCLVVDSLDHGQNLSRAVVVHAHTLEVLETIGVADELVRQGLAISKIAIRDRDQALLRVPLDHLPSAYRYLLMVPQDVTETILGARLTALGGMVHRGVTATAIERHEGGATATLATPDGEGLVTARYVVGADGMHSLVRRFAGIAFEGSTYEESFVLADVKMQWMLDPDENSLFLSPDGPVLVVPLPGGSFRVVAMMADPPQTPTRMDVQNLIDTRGPAGLNNIVQEVRWSSRFRIHHRVARSYRDGPVFLVGDAAHVHSPAGGQGMNVGLVDAVVLGRLLVRVLGNNHPDATLDAYSELRRPAAVEVLALASRLTRMAIMRGAFARTLRNGLLRTVDRLPPVKRRLAMQLSGLSRKARSEVG